MWRRAARSAGSSAGRGCSGSAQRCLCPHLRRAQRMLAPGTDAPRAPRPAPRQITKAYYIPRPHTSVRVRLTFVKIDLWDGETAFLRVDGTLVWSRTWTCDVILNGLCANTSAPGESLECGLPGGASLICQSHQITCWFQEAPRMLVSVSDLTRLPP